MNSLLSGLILVFWAGCTFAAPSKQVIESCLRTEAVSNQVQYEDLKPNSLNQEDDETKQTTSNTIAFHNRQIGIWEAKNSKRFGLVYGDKKIPIRRVIQLGKDVPRAFEHSIPIQHNGAKRITQKIPISALPLILKAWAKVVSFKTYVACI
jgi:hypothetical protein